MNGTPKYVAAAILVFTLALGIFIGVTADRCYINRNFHEMAKYRFIKDLERHGPGRFFNPPPRRSEDHGRLIREKLIQGLEKRLQLNVDQVEKIKAVLERQRIEIDKNRKRFLGEIKNSVDRTYLEISRHLNDIQKSAFNRMIEDHRGTGESKDR